MSYRIAVVTGASSGIGKATCERLISEGWQVLGISRSENRLSELRSALGDNFDWMAIDVTKEDAPKEIFEYAKTNFDRYPDTVIVNAGRGIQGSITDIDFNEFKEVIDLNVTSTVRLLKIAAEKLPDVDSRKRDIVVIGTASAKHISPFSSAYGSTKAAIHYCTEALRRQLSKKRVRVSLIMPGWVKTEFQHNGGYDSDLNKMFEENFGDPLLAEDISQVISNIVNSPVHVCIGEISVRPIMQDYP